MNGKILQKVLVNSWLWGPRAMGIGLLVVIVSMITTPTFAQDVSFSGKTVRILINFGTGSSTDVIVRRFAPYVAKYLPGNPNVIVEAKPGGRGTLGAAYAFKNVRPNGETVAILVTLIGRWAIGEKLPVDITKFVHVGAFPGNAVIYARTDSGLKSFEDLANPPKPIITGATAPNTAAALPFRLFLNTIGQKGKYKLITGYRGQLGMLKAMRSGEINTAFLNPSVWMARLPGIQKEGILNGLMEYGLPGKEGEMTTTPDLGLPTMDAVWRKLAPTSLSGGEYRASRAIMAANALNFLFVLPPGTDSKFTNVWNYAFARAFEDSDYLSDLKKTNTPPQVWIDTATAVRILGRIPKDFTDTDIKAALGSVFIKK